MISEHITELERRKKKLEEVLVNLPLNSVSESEEVKNMISLLIKEKDLAFDKLNGLKNFLFYFTFSGIKPQEPSSPSKNESRFVTTRRQHDPDPVLRG